MGPVACVDLFHANCRFVDCRMWQGLPGLCGNPAESSQSVGLMLSIVPIGQRLIRCRWDNSLQDAEGFGFVHAGHHKPYTTTLHHQTHVVEVPAFLPGVEERCGLQRIQLNDFRPCMMKGRLP